ncbi:MAG: 3-methyl-2-oxobutanoate hydroxymethyltransferase [Chloroflexi bacterium]|nr:3-methyl-2-oxobutanoate hydroxymethyltransferase [Chloroflexota bacterium]|tara:strand:+ start:1695 stop:2534 length:840 start_codon:yes stop_codon:yes gene_type:complete
MRLRTTALKGMKESRKPIICITAYDYQIASLVEQAGIDVILVGDSLGNVVLGYDSTVPVTLDEMVHHTKAVMRGSKSALVVADMPFLTYNLSVEDSLKNAGRLIQEGGAQAVKIEGGQAVVETVHRLTEIGIPVMGHLGLTPQSVHQMGGYLIQGRTLTDAKKLVNDAKMLEQSGAFAIVLEGVPTELAKIITQDVSIPTIGIGASENCDGQIQVINDILGFSSRYPKHSKQYADMNAVILQALNDYSDEVRMREFPTSGHASHMDPSVLSELLKGENI